jgi:hypothetical protein
MEISPKNTESTEESRVINMAKERDEETNKYSEKEGKTRISERDLDERKEDREKNYEK